MSEAASPTQAAAQGQARARMTTPQMLHLMRLEVDRANRHDYPVSCMYFGLDGFLESETLLFRKVLMPLVFQQLKRVCLANDVRGMGIWTEGFQLAVFPHVTPEQIKDLADQLLERAREVHHDDIPEELATTLSIGISHNIHKGERSFETLVKDAEAGMGMALASGGDQVSGWRQVESELDALKEELEESLREIEEFQQTAFGDNSSDEVWGKQLVTKVLDVFQREPDQSQGVIRLEKEVIALLKTELAAWTETSSGGAAIEAQRQIDQLQRRVAKLTQSLERTEAELKRVASMKNVDFGVSSIYRTVQGLSDDDDQLEAKADMLKNIFDANMALRAEMASKES